MGPKQNTILHMMRQKYKKNQEKRKYVFVNFRRNMNSTIVTLNLPYILTFFQMGKVTAIERECLHSRFTANFGG